MEGLQGCKDMAGLWPGRADGQAGASDWGVIGQEPVLTKGGEGGAKIRDHVG